MNLRILGALVILVALVGCSSVAYMETEEGKDIETSSVSPSQVAVYSVSSIGQGYSVVGEVVAAVDSGSNANGAVASLQQMAARLGADAIINMRLEVEYGYWMAGIKATGTAVKLK